MSVALQRYLCAFYVTAVCEGQVIPPLEGKKGKDPRIIFFLADIYFRKKKESLIL